MPVARGLIEVAGLTKRFTEVAADGIDLDVASGECPTTWRAVLPDPHG